MASEICAFLLGSGGREDDFVVFIGVSFYQLAACSLKGFSSA
jgi:hypothetical protein